MRPIGYIALFQCALSLEHIPSAIQALLFPDITFMQAHIRLLFSNSLPMHRSTQQVPGWFEQWTRTLRSHGGDSSWDSRQVEGRRSATGVTSGCTGWNCPQQPRKYQPLLQQCLHKMEESKLNNTPLHLVNSSPGSGESNSWGEETGKQDQEWTDWAPTTVTSWLVSYLQVILLYLLRYIFCGFQK